MGSRSRILSRRRRRDEAGDLRAEPFDVLDTEYFSLKKLVPSGKNSPDGRQEDQGVRQDHAGFTKGQLRTQGHWRRGDRAEKVMSSKASTRPNSRRPDGVGHADSDRLNADTLGIRSDLIKAVNSEGLRIAQPRAKGKAATPTFLDGTMDADGGRKSTGKQQYSYKGNMTKSEIDMTMRLVLMRPRSWLSSRLWKDFMKSVIDGLGEQRLQAVHVVAAADGGCARRESGVFSAKERSSLPRRPPCSLCMSKGVTRNRPTWSTWFVNWDLSGWLLDESLRSKARNPFGGSVHC